MLSFATSHKAHSCNQLNHVRCQFLCHVLKAIFFIEMALKLSYFCKKMQNFRALGLRPQTPVPPAAGGFAHRPPKQPHHREFLATRLS